MTREEQEQIWNTWCETSLVRTALGLSASMRAAICNRHEQERQLSPVPDYSTHEADVRAYRQVTGPTMFAVSPDSMVWEPEVMHGCPDCGDPIPESLSRCGNCALDH